MRDMLARRGEVVALEVADLAFAADGTATVLIRRSKTDQAGAGEVCWLAQQTAPPASALAGCRRHYRGPDFSAGLARPGVVGSTGLAGGQVSRILKRLAQQAGLESLGGFRSFGTGWHGPGSGRQRQ